jgi:hypothetical protein
VVDAAGRHPGPSRGKTWRCVCACGAETVAQVRDLNSGNTTSCGCVQRSQVRSRKPAIAPGARFGKLTVSGFVGKDDAGFKRFLCVCDCGTDTIVRGNLLNAGQTKSCGCLRLIGFVIRRERSEVFGTLDPLAVAA